MATLYTIGHSTTPQEDFVHLLQAHDIELLVDIRSFPASKRLSHFWREQMEKWLPAAGIDYQWMKALGGRRNKIRDDSPHTALRSESFRNYADYTLTAEFRLAAEKLLTLAESQKTAYMCAERLWFNCHRMIVSDYLTAMGHTVLHIMDKKPPKTHVLMPDARIVEGQLLYIGDRLF